MPYSIRHSPSMNILLKINIAFLALLLLALAVILEESPLHGLWEKGVAQVAMWWEPHSTDIKDLPKERETPQADPEINLALVPFVPDETAPPTTAELAEGGVPEVAPDPFENLEADPNAPTPERNPRRALIVPADVAVPAIAETEPESVTVAVNEGAGDTEAEVKTEAVAETDAVTVRTAQPPLRIATEGNFPPFNFINDEGQLAGFEVDLVRALCTQLKRKCELYPQEWDALLPGLTDGKWDVAMASLRIPEQAAEGVLYTKPYYRLPAQLVVRQGDATHRRVPELAGKEILVQSGSRHEAYVMQNFPKALRRTVPTFEEAWDRFVLGEANFFFGDRVAILQHMSDTRCCELVGGPVMDASFFSQGVGFALPNTDAPSSKELKTQLENGLSTLIANGTYEEISTKYFNENIF
ncbi:MAG: transporter substrate-binding domain-containing protein [Parvibaculaceae bacterium]|nr:transporter substrate-binding domain-containing protein [Parvibaculaceae bacterium]